LSSAKEKRGKERSEEKEKKRKRWEKIHISKVVEGRSLNLDLELKLGEIVEDYKTLLFSKFQKKRMCFVRVMSLWRFCVRSSFLVISPLFELFLDLQLWDLIDHKGIYMWEKFQVIHLKFQPKFWSQFLLRVITFCGSHQ
jgi:hypothetical protein